MRFLVSGVLKIPEVRARKANCFAAGLFYWSNLTGNATPAKERYLAERYAEEWEGYRRQVKWKMFPGIF